MKKNKINTRVVTDKFWYQQEELWVQMFKCPNCNKGQLIPSYKYCPDCGIKLIWRISDEKRY